MSDKEHVALVHYACPACTQKCNEEILLATKWRNGQPVPDLKPMHNQCIGISKTLCPECLKLAKEHDGVWLIGVDSKKTDDRNSPFRNGVVLMVRRESVKVELPNRWTFVEDLPQPEIPTKD